MPSLFDGLTQVGLRGSGDMRPILIRVLTDLYVQKLTHTEEEERHYTELALRLLAAVDTATRTSVATKLARHLSPPIRVAQYLLNDLPAVAAPLRGHTVLRRLATAAPPKPQPVTAPAAEAASPAVTFEVGPETTESTAAALSDHPIEPAYEGPQAETERVVSPPIASELNTLFFTATEEERRLILLNLHIAAPLSVGEVEVLREPMISQKLEAAALGRNRHDLAKHFALALQISGEQAGRITRDNFGEPMVVAIKALGVPRDVFHRILMFANPVVGHSVERVQALAALFDELPLPAAEAMVAIWQALPKAERTASKHQPLHWDDQETRARSATGQTRRLQSVQRPTERRHAAS